MAADKPRGAATLLTTGSFKTKTGSKEEAAREVELSSSCKGKTVCPINVITLSKPVLVEYKDIWHSEVYRT